MTVYFTFVFGSLAGSGSDLTPISGFSLVFNGTTIIQSVTININRDMRLEINEQFLARLRAVVRDPDIRIAPAVAEITIIDDDSEFLTPKPLVYWLATHYYLCN